METKYYQFSQNNTGGVFEYDKNLSNYVMIEAESSDKANSLALSIGIYFDGCNEGIDCSCCGDRWYKASEDDGYSEPLVYGRKMNNKDIWFPEKNGRYAVIHKLDGTIEELFKD